MMHVRLLLMVQKVEIKSVEVQKEQRWLLPVRPLRKNEEWSGVVAKKSMKAEVEWKVSQLPFQSASLKAKKKKLQVGGQGHQ